MKMFRENLAWVAMVMGLLILLVLGTLQGYAAPPVGPEEKPAAALYAVSWNTSSITSDTTSTAYTTQSYCYHDLFCSIDMSTTNTITVKYQVSPDNSNWFDSFAFSAQTADADIFTRTLAYGRYSRVVLDVTNSETITPVCKSVFFNNWTPANYVAQMNQ